MQADPTAVVVQFPNGKCALTPCRARQPMDPALGVAVASSRSLLFFWPPQRVVVSPVRLLLLPNHSSAIYVFD